MTLLALLGMALPNLLTKGVQLAPERREQQIEMLLVQIAETDGGLLEQAVSQIFKLLAKASLCLLLLALTVQQREPWRSSPLAVRFNNNQARIRKEGFSLLDMRRYLRSKGYEADGFELPLDKLQQENVPAIVLLNDRGYRHFVVVKGLRDGRVLLGDPARGTRAMPRSRFEALWDNRVMFVVHNQRQRARFNQARDWQTAPPAPLDMGIQRDGLRNVTVPRRGPGDI